MGPKPGPVVQSAQGGPLAPLEKGLAAPSMQDLWRSTAASMGPTRFLVQSHRHQLTRNRQRCQLPLRSKADFTGFLREFEAFVSMNFSLLSVGVMLTLSNFSQTSNPYQLSNESMNERQAMSR